MKIRYVRDDRSRKSFRSPEAVFRRKVPSLGTRFRTSKRRTRMNYRPNSRNLAKSPSRDRRSGRRGKNREYWNREDNDGPRKRTRSDRIDRQRIPTNGRVGKESALGTRESTDWPSRIPKEARTYDTIRPIENSENPRRHRRAHGFLRKTERDTGNREFHSMNCRSDQFTRTERRDRSRPCRGTRSRIRGGCRRSSETFGRISAIF